MLRTSPIWKFENFILTIDIALKNALESILNINFKDNEWTQGSLPIKLGGIGVRKIKDLTLPAFLAFCKWLKKSSLKY